MQSMGCESQMNRHFFSFADAIYAYGRRSLDGLFEVQGDGHYHLFDVSIDIWHQFDPRDDTPVWLGDIIRRRQ